MKSKILVGAIVLALIIVGFFAMVPRNVSATNVAIVNTRDSAGNPKTYFRLGDDVYYYLIASDTKTGFLKFTQFKVQIIDTNNKNVYTNIVTTDSNAENKSWLRGDSYTISPTDPLGVWKIQVLNTSLAVIGTNTFEVYEPVYSATVNTTLPGYIIDEKYYNQFEPVNYTVTVLDQHGRPPPVPYWVDVYGNHSDDRYQVDNNLLLDANGYVKDDFSPWIWWPAGMFGSDPGLYTLEIENATGDVIGSTTFNVVTVGISISPDKATYGQGGTIEIKVVMAYYSGRIDVSIANSSGGFLYDAIWNDQNLTNGTWTVDYMLRMDLPDDNYQIYVNESATGHTLATKQFSVKKYTLYIYTNRIGYLPGETITVYYEVISNNDGSGVTGTKIEWRFRYFDLAVKYLTGSLSSTPATGKFVIEIPTDAQVRSDGFIEVWANETGRSDYRSVGVNLGNLWADVYTDSGEYYAGGVVVVTITAKEDDAWSGIPNANVTFKVSLAGEELTEYAKDDLVTDMTGTCKHIFVLNDTSLEGTYTIEVNVSKLDYWDVDTATFDVVKPSESLVVNIMFDKAEYYSGDSVTVKYTLSKYDGTHVSGNSKYEVYLGGTTLTVGTDSTGTITFTLPNDITGYLRIDIDATDAGGNSGFGSESVWVYSNAILINANKVEFLPGDTLTFTYSTVGIVPAGTQYFYKVEGTVGWVSEVMQEGSLGTSPTGTFSYTVPTQGYWDEYRATVYMTRPDGQSASAYIYVDKADEYTLTWEITTESKYVTGEFKPEDTITIHYKITPVGDSPIPPVVTIYYGIYGFPKMEYRTTSLEGDITYTIPKGISNGNHMIIVDSDYTSESLQTIKINSSPSALNYRITKGLSLFGLILLLLLILLILIGIGMYIRYVRPRVRVKREEKFVEPVEGKIEDTPPTEEETKT